jgi:hypothetical protein
MRRGARRRDVLVSCGWMTERNPRLRDGVQLGELGVGDGGRVWISGLSWTMREERFFR